VIPADSGRIDLDELRHRLSAELETLAETLFGQPNRSQSTRHQLRFGSKGSLAVELRRDRATWCSHETGQGGGVFELIMFATNRDFAGAVRWAREWLRMAPAERPKPPEHRPVADRDDAAAKANKAVLAARIWRESTSIAGTPAETCLATRGCAAPTCKVLRFHPSCPRGAERLPAMIALMTSPAKNEPTGIHRTFLRPDGRGKIQHGKEKKMLGGAGVVRLVEDGLVTAGLGIAEGIETSLAIMRNAGWRPVWAAGSAGGITDFPVLPGVETLTIFPDRDDKGAGIIAAEACAARWRAAGREARMIVPPIGRDWLDALAAKVAA